MQFYDLIYSRYAAPEHILDQMINHGRLLDFVQNLIRIKNNETEEKTLWEFFLHRVHDKTYADFRSSIAKPEKASEFEIEDSITGSFNMLNSFVPE